ncbi:MAG: hypothetical protein KME15_08220 [Drouetiella hepatica Uher 2000/2452]|uniref:Uncharacterized protein n=1 Tax=Drouetiella hepatica Uher 2000/2452 TaxID=904376 RepID=A0A951QB53_9CYAN|nr:hypothetical protein [Drouetiella hepatica Uher 2000/2452]
MSYATLQNTAEVSTDRPLPNDTAVLLWSVRKELSKKLLGSKHGQTPRSFFNADFSAYRSL